MCTFCIYTDLDAFLKSSDKCLPSASNTFHFIFSYAKVKPIYSFGPQFLDLIKQVAGHFILEWLDYTGFTADVMQQHHDYGLNKCTKMLTGVYT